MVVGGGGGGGESGGSPQSLPYRPGQRSLKTLERAVYGVGGWGWGFEPIIMSLQRRTDGVSLWSLQHRGLEGVCTLNSRLSSVLNLGILKTECFVLPGSTALLSHKQYCLTVLHPSYLPPPPSPPPRPSTFHLSSAATCVPRPLVQIPWRRECQ